MLCRPGDVMREETSPGPARGRHRPRPVSPLGAGPRWALLALGLLGAAALTGCPRDDVGTCCTLLPGADVALIPVPDPANPDQDVIRLDPSFDCSGLTCVSYQGSKAYCTRECQAVADCPVGFDCRTVLQSDPGPGANIRPTTKFCIRDAHVCGD
jgi:hypothetical protein